ncbi:MAG: flagellar basal body P-ring protein FlgI [Pseudomonadales bacterium]|jgi:flagellar P-ring protein precursor FlgI|nr:flagellar basal body P-ring protein FlgI [Pseudomonadales bacterium]
MRSVTSSLLRPSLLLLALLAVEAGADRVKDVAEVAGVRANQLVGYGLVVGLDGTGDSSAFTGQSIRNMLNRLGVALPPGVNPDSRNVAGVIVQASLPAFAKPGNTIDVTVSALGDAESLRGGSLLMTPLQAVNGQVFAIAQGNLVVGGLGASGRDGSRVTVNVPSAGRIPNGAIVEREVPSAFTNADALHLNLHRADFTTAARLVEAINERFGGEVADAVDAGTVSVRAPVDAGQRVAFVSMLENLSFRPGDAPARVVVNSRTGTVVIGSNVRVSPAAVSHGNLVVTIVERPLVSQPAPFGEGDTVVAPVSEITVDQQNGRMFKFDPGASLDAIVEAVNGVGAAPGDLVAILEALREAGALRAELVVI